MNIFGRDPAAPGRHPRVIVGGAVLALAVATAGLASALTTRNDGADGRADEVRDERPAETAMALATPTTPVAPAEMVASPAAVPAASAEATVPSMPVIDREGAPDLVQAASDALRTSDITALSVGPAVPISGVHDAVSRVRVSIRSSANWASIQIPLPSEVVNATLVGSSGHNLFWRADGVVISTPDTAFRKAAIVDFLVADNPTVVQPWKLLLPRGASGSATVTALNDLARPKVIARVESSAQQKEFLVDGAAVARNGPLNVGRAEHSGLVLANFVPWHPTGDYSRFNNRPADPSASTADPAYVRRAIDSAGAAGIDGFMVSYFGLPHRDVDAYFQAASTVPGWRSALMLETKVANAGRTWREKPDPAVLEQWITSAMDRFRNHPSLLRLADGRAVFFAYRADLVSAEAWRGIIDRVGARGDRIAIVGSDMRAESLSSLSGLFTYNSLVYDDLPAAYRVRSDLTRTDHLLHPKRERKIWVATVTPGMNYTGPALDARYYDRENGDRYRRQWEAALASGADWVLVVTWNDYAEETTIEASREWGDQYLRITRGFTQ